LYLSLEKALKAAERIVLVEVRTCWKPQLGGSPCTLDPGTHGRSRARPETKAAKIALLTQVERCFAMANPCANELCTSLSGTSVGNRSGEEFYNYFNLMTCDYVEYSFNEMKDIFYLPGMDNWRSVLKESDRHAGDVTITLVSFQPYIGKQSKRQLTAFEKVNKMFISCFDSADHKHINAAMKTFPTMGIFLSLKKKANRKRKLPVKDPSIFDDGNANQVHCLCAVNYFRHEQHTVVLWLATTINKPFEESIHTIWRNNGLATYLLCMLIKQHTGAGPNMDKSILCLQASHEMNQDACRFYK
jgi:hypothetical protein